MIVLLPLGGRTGSGSGDFTVGSGFHVTATTATTTRIAPQTSLLVVLRGGRDRAPTPFGGAIFGSPRAFDFRGRRFGIPVIVKNVNKVINLSTIF